MYVEPALDVTSLARDKQLALLAVGVNDLDQAEFESLYGPWISRTPTDVAELFEGYTGVWWISGGWALEAFTGVTRPHEDIDPSVLGAELPTFRRLLTGRLHMWTATSGALAPLLPDDQPDGTADEVLPEGCVQVWTRRSAHDPWEYDVLLSPGTADEWVYRRDPGIRMPMSQALWHRDGIAYLQPEIQLLYKAKGLRPKDQADFQATLPHLDDPRRTWLQQSLIATLGDHHPWVGSLT